MCELAMSALLTIVLFVTAASAYHLQGQSVNSVPTRELAVDQFGIQKIYADAPQPVNNWVFAGDVNDPRLMEERFVKAKDGWFKPEDPAKMRVEVLSDPAANEKTIETFD